VLHICDRDGRVYGCTTLRRMEAADRTARRLRERVCQINAAIRWWWSDRGRSRYVRELQELETRAAGVYDPATVEEKRRLLRKLKDTRHRIKLLARQHGLRRLKSICGGYCTNKTCSDSYLRGQLTLVRLITATVLNEESPGRA
jgi:hypothetical protein